MRCSSMWRWRAAAGPIGGVRCQWKEQVLRGEGQSPGGSTPTNSAILAANGWPGGAGKRSLDDRDRSLVREVARQSRDSLRQKQLQFKKQELHENNKTT
mmetsp:Transcript_25374/g.42789  ORF Transcript_25374/g.42789 Transcript_25374/m.42789 type:complete len:99 (+) Transcript_25374:208-504(+)